MEQTLLNLKNYDYELAVRVNLAGDLRAKEVRYHSLCIIKSNRRMKQNLKPEENLQYGKSSFRQICYELQALATQEKVWLQIYKCISVYIICMFLLGEITYRFFVYRWSL